MTTTAVNMEHTTPMVSVMAKPLMVPAPKIISTRPAMMVVMLESRIAENARLNPLSTEARTVLPARISSFMRSKMMTLASTAMPMDSTMPAMPGSVSCTPGITARRNRSIRM